MTYHPPLEQRLGFYAWLRTSLPWRALLRRCVRLITRSRDEWAAVAYEPRQVMKMMVPFALILSFLGPMTQFWGTLYKMVFGPLSLSLSGVSYSLFLAVVGAVLNLLIVFTMAQIVQGVALRHGRKLLEVQAYQLGIYGLTAFWLAQGLSHLPLMGGAAIVVGTYSLYQLYTGTERLVEVDPADRRKVNLMVPGLALVFYMAILGVAELVVWLARAWPVS